MWNIVLLLLTLSSVHAVGSCTYSVVFYSTTITTTTTTTTNSIIITTTGTTFTLQFFYLFNHLLELPQATLSPLKVSRFDS